MPPAEKLKLPDPPAAVAPVAPPVSSPKTVRMHHPERDNKEADVHPDEVAGWQLHGWRLKG